MAAGNERHSPGVCVFVCTYVTCGNMDTVYTYAYAISGEEWYVELYVWR